MTRVRFSLVATLVLACLAAACAPTLQQAGRPDIGFTGPRLEDHAFVSFDGARLGLTRWDAKAPAEPWAVIIGVHGMNDYAAAFHLAAPWWAARGVTTLAYDQRGFGRSPGRGVWAPDALRTEDLRTLVALARARYPHATLAVVGERGLRLYPPARGRSGGSGGAGCVGLVQPGLAQPRRSVARRARRAG